MSETLQLGAELEGRFWAKVDKSQECWLWLAGKTGTGYGAFALSSRRQIRAHRLAYELTIGPIPAGLVIDHLCRNRACVNPDHLEPVTNAENILRGTSPQAMNARKQVCPVGHEYRWRDGSRRYCRECQTAAERRRLDAERMGA